MLKKIKRILMIGLLILPLAGGLIACEKEGPAERAGEKIDEAVEKAGDKMDEAGDKMKDAAEEAGDKVEEATD